MKKIKVVDESTNGELGHVIRDLAYSRRLDKVIIGYHVRFWVW